jgi:hypothetical protein
VKSRTFYSHDIFCVEYVSKFNSYTLGHRQKPVPTLERVYNPKWSSVVKYIAFALVRGLFLAFWNVQIMYTICSTFWKIGALMLSNEGLCICMVVTKLLPRSWILVEDVGGCNHVCQQKEK